MKLDEKYYQIKLNEIVLVYTKPDEEMISILRQIATDARDEQAKKSEIEMVMAHKEIMRFPEVGVGHDDVDPLFINKVMRKIAAARIRGAK